MAAVITFITLQLVSHLLPASRARNAGTVADIATLEAVVE
jgi:hypothetical protein